MNRRIIALLLALTVVLSCGAALADTMPAYSWYYATLNQRISSRTGPGTRYDNDAFTVNSIGAGTTLRILSRAYDSPNARWWVQTEITYQGRQYRLYTGEQRFNGLDLSSIPEEYQLGECVAPSGGVYDCYAGPGTNYAGKPSIPAYTRCTIWGYEENYGEDTDYIQVEYYDNASGCYRRCWCAEWWMSDETMYYGWPGNQSSYNPGQGSYNPGQGSYNPGQGSQQSYPQDDWPLYTTCRVSASSGRVRTGPGVNYSEAGYVNQGQEFQILEVRMGDTGKDWYKISGYFGTAWVSSGLVTVWRNGTRYENGTVNGVPVGN